MHREALRYRYTAQVAAPLLTRLVRMRAWSAASRLLALHCRVWRAGDGPTLLLLPKAGFNEDAMTAFGSECGEGYRLLALDRNLVKAVFAAYLPAHVDDNNYRVDDPGLLQGMTDLRAAWQRLWDGALGRMGIRAVCTGNFSYASEQELAGVCKERGVGFLAMHKECLKTPGLLAFYEDVYATRKGPFQGSLITLYNRMERDLQVRAGVFPESGMRITGMPRLDRLHRLREAGGAVADPTPTVLFFSFNVKSGLPFIGRKLPERFEVLERDLERLHVREMCMQAHRAVLELARRHPEIQVQVKTKGDVQAGVTMREAYGDNPAFPDNFRIIPGGDLLGPLSKATAVAGFNSTSLLEALALHKPVWVPRWAEGADPSLAPYVVDLEDAVAYAESPEDLVAGLAAAAKQGGQTDPGAPLPESTRRLLDHWCGNPDGLAGARTRAALKEIL